MSNYESLLEENTEEEKEKENIEENEIYNEAETEWSAWGAEIKNEIDNILMEVGDRDNAHYFPALAERLLKDINTFPLWSNVCRDDFGYGRVPASSAAVEGEFNKLKNNLLKNSRHSLRIDEFIKLHLDYLHGRIKLVDTKERSASPSDKSIDISNRDKEIENITINSSLNDVQSQIKICSACANGDKPSGAHVCIICKLAVHAIENCSVAYGEEGYGQERICTSCFDSSHKILASQEIENWRGLNSHKKIRTARYLGDNQCNIKDSLTWNRCTKLPIIKNGSTMTLHAIKLNNNNYCLTHTCAFDSLLQLVLVILSDYEHFQNEVNCFYLFSRTYFHISLFQ